MSIIQLQQLATLNHSSFLYTYIHLLYPLRYFAFYLIFLKVNFHTLTVFNCQDFFFFFLHPMACGILVPQPGMESLPPIVETQSLNYWTPREVPNCQDLYITYLSFLGGP